jgi:hypothetical protein
MRDLESVRRLAPPADPPAPQAIARMRVRALAKRPRRPRVRWLVAPAIGATAIALLAFLLPAGGGQAPAFAAALVRAAEDAPRLLLGADWSVTRVDEWSAGTGEMTFSDGTREISLRWWPAPPEGIRVRTENDPDLVVVTAVDVPGARAQVLQYEGFEDFIAVWLVGDAMVEARGIGIRLDEFRAIVDGFEAVGAHAWLSALPSDAVTPSEQPDGVDAMLAGLPLPPGFDRAAIRSGSETRDRYQLGARVAGTVACGWIAVWAKATAGGDDAAAAQAATALASSRDWAVLREMNAGGEYPEALWRYADAVAGSGTIDGGKPAMSVKDTYKDALCP